MGPRRDDVLKPDIAAPGQGVGAALSSATTVNARAILLDGVHVVFQGTSMSTPHAAGLMALMFENLGNLSVRAVASRIRGSARRDEFTGPNPGPTWGWGKIDVLGATGHVVPVLLIEAEASQENGGVRVRFLLAEDSGTAPLEVYREGPDDPLRRILGWSSSGRERTFADSTLTEEGDYRYWLRVPDEGGTTWIGPATIHYVPGGAPWRLDLSPNPFVQKIRIRWSPTTGPADLTIHGLSGRRIRTLTVREEPGSRVVEWDGKDARGHEAPAGVYLVRLRLADGRQFERKILRLK